MHVDSLHYTIFLTIMTKSFIQVYFVRHVITLVIAIPDGKVRMVNYLQRFVLTYNSTHLLLWQQNPPLIKVYESVHNKMR